MCNEIVEVRPRGCAAMEDVGAVSGAVPTQTVQVAKLDTLGENAVGAAADAQAGMQDQRPQKAAENAPWSQMNLAEKHTAIRAEQARRAASSNAGGGSSAGNGSTGAANGERTESLYGPNTSGYVGTAGSYDALGNYTSGTTRGGAPTGGSRLDAFDREIGAYNQFTRDIMGRTGSGPNGSSSNTRVICTELVRQGRMAPSLQRLDIAFTLRELSPATVRGYHVWAVPYVRWMRRSKFATAFIQPIATWRALEIAHQLGERDTPHYGGKLVRLIMEPTCWLVGHVAAWLPGDPDRFHPYLQR